MRRATLFCTMLVAATFVVAGCSTQNSGDASDPFATLPGAVYEPPRPAAPLRLSSGEGARFDLVEHRGQVTLVFFGFTNCPDVCPETMLEWEHVHAAMGADTTSVRFVFVSVDPERDTPAVAADYARKFHPSFIGLSGTRPEVTETVQAWGAAGESPPGAESAAPMHSSQVFVVDRDGMLRWGYGRSTDVETIVRGIRVVRGLPSRRA